MRKRPLYYCWSMWKVKSMKGRVIGFVIIAWSKNYSHVCEFVGLYINKLFYHTIRNPCFLSCSKKRKKMSKKTGTMSTKHHLKLDQPKHAKNIEKFALNMDNVYLDVPVLTSPRLPTNIFMFFTTSRSLWCSSTFLFPKCWCPAKCLRFLVTSQKIGVPSWME
jgi:hypothetical protein